MKKILLLTLIFLIIAGGLYYVNNYSKKGVLSVFTSGKIPSVSVANRKFKVVIAKTPKELQIGLSETKSLSNDQGMVFIFDRADYYPFWMKNMKFPIDIIYINKDTVATIINNAKAPKNNNENLTVYTPTTSSDKVLEINSGLAQKYNFKIGDKVTYENLGN
jgi:uncharacterized protein